MNENSFRRRFPRRRFKKPVGLLVQGKFTATMAVEVGEGGMAFEFDTELNKGQKIVLSFFIPGQSFVSVTAEIAFVKPTEGKKGFYTYGIKYLNLDFESQRMIRDYIADKTSEQLAV